MRKEFLELLLKDNKLVVGGNFNHNQDKSLVMAIVNSFLSLGYNLTEEAITKLAKCGLADLTLFYQVNYAILKDVKGDNPHQVFYPNFPNLADISEYEYAVRANLHYLTATSDDYGFRNQDIEEEDRVDNSESETVKYITLDVLTEEEAISYLRKKIVSFFEMNSPISHAYRDTFSMFAKKYGKLNISQIPFKENIGVYINTLENPKALKYEDLRFCQTVTDVLRVYVAISTGSAFLSYVKFISLPRASRRALLKKLDELTKPYSEDDYQKHIFLWKRAFEYLHVGEFKQFINVYVIANKIRNLKLNTFNSRVESYNKSLDWNNLLDLLKTRPGEFARRLDSLIAREPYADIDSNDTIDEFKKVANQVSTKVLIELWNHFNNRNKFKTRVFKIPGDFITSYYEIPEERADLRQFDINRVKTVIEQALYDKFSNLEKLENVYLEPETKNVLALSQARNTSLSFNNLSYGQKIKLEAKKFLRVFTTWKNQDDFRQDIDIAVQLFDDNLEEVATLSWYHMAGGKKFDAYHSGDLTSGPAPYGATEFIDVNLEKAKTCGRYLVLSNTIFSGLGYNELDYCYSGVMLSNNRQNKLIVPSLVQIQSKLVQKNCSSCLSFVIDLETMTLVWLDTPVDDRMHSVISENQATKSVLIDAFKDKMTMYDFMLMHKGHIGFVDKPDENSLIIGVSDKANVNVLDQEVITSQWF